MEEWRALIEAQGKRDDMPMKPQRCVTADQTLKFAEALAKGQPHRGKIALTVLSYKVRESV